MARDIGSDMQHKNKYLTKEHGTKKSAMTYTVPDIAGWLL